MTTINIAQIARSAGTQFRAEVEKGSKEHARRESNIEDMMDLIERGVSFKTPIRLARCNDTLYLVDGFHRIAAYTRLKMMEIPTGQYVVVDAATIEEVRALAAGANVAHGKGNTEADYHNIIMRMMELGDTYMKNCFEPDIKKIAEAIGAARPAVGRGYNDYTGTKEKPLPSLSSVCKEKRDAAILEQHKAGMSNKAIARLFKLNPNSGHTQVKEILEGRGVENPDSGKTTPQSSPTTLAQANTFDRYDTRIDANTHLDNLLADILSEEDDEYLLTEDEADDNEQDDRPPFDVLAVTGFGEDIASHAKPVKKVDPVKLQERFITIQEKRERLAEQYRQAMAELDKQEVEVRQIATAEGISLPA